MKKFNILTAALLCCCVLPAHALSIASPSESFLYSYDQNGDHKLSLKEFLDIKTAPDSKLVWDFAIDHDSFKTLDRNRNGFLDSEDELPIGYTQDVYDEIQCWPRPRNCNEPWYSRLTDSLMRTYDEIRCWLHCE